ncbi:hypothetical protein GCM10023081_43660 [Arthrobacter ginkgonis]|uniref:Uncharacterized protein n=1 Tax=Arthrobacter ginkgonis TaxID=1630594 RepID=A0ABP7DBY5_9MICC
MIVVPPETGQSARNVTAKTVTQPDVPPRCRQWVAALRLRGRQSREAAPAAVYAGPSGSGPGVPRPPTSPNRGFHQAIYGAADPE